MQRRRWIMLAGVVAALASLAFFVAACDDGGGGEATPTEPAATGPATTEPADQTPTEAATVNVETLDPDFSFNVDLDTVATDTVTFNVANVGSIPHNFRVIMTDLAVDALPLTEDGQQVDEEDSQLVVLARTPDIDPGDTAQVEVTNLPPGKYVLICNIVGHYDAGSRAAFTVE